MKIKLFRGRPRQERRTPCLLYIGLEVDRVPGRGSGSAVTKIRYCALCVFAEDRDRRKCCRGWRSQENITIKKEGSGKWEVRRELKNGRAKQYGKFIRHTAWAPYSTRFHHGLYHLTRHWKDRWVAALAREQDTGATSG